MEVRNCPARVHWAIRQMTFSGTGTSKKITFGARNKAKLSAAQLALVTDKGWVLG